MAEYADKARPMAERIAGLDVKSSFRDIRDGIGSVGSAYGSITDQDIAAALGMVKTAVGKLPVWALETYYGSTLIHEHKLRSAWAEKSETIEDAIDQRIRNRVCAALAIREFAGAPTPSSLIVEWSTLTAWRPDLLRRQANQVLAWLEEAKSTGLQRLKRAMVDVHAEKAEREAKKRA